MAFVVSVQGSCLPLQQMRWPSQRSRMAFWKVCIAGIRWPDSAERRYQRHIDEHRVFNHRRSKQQSCQHQYQSRTPCTWILDVELSHSDAPTPVVVTRLNNPFEPKESSKLTSQFRLLRHCHSTCDSRMPSHRRLAKSHTGR